MTVVVPALLAANQNELNELEIRVQTFAGRVHIDIKDGLFAPDAGILASDLIWPAGWIVDVHVMYKDPVAILPTLIALKPSMVIIHAEADGDLLGVLDALKQAGILAGVAVMRPTVPADHVDLIAAADHVMIFSGNLGQYGGTANMLQIEKVRLIKAINPVVEIGWDGGANVANAYTLALGGVDVVNVGSALAQAGDPAEVYRRLDFEVHRKDIIKNKEAKG